MSIGHRLAVLRKSKGLTQSRLASLADLSASTIAMYETNRRQPDGAALEKLATALGVALDELADIQQTDRNQSVENIADHATGLTTLALSREEARVILFLRMNPQSHPFISSYIRADGRKREQVEKTWRLIHDFQN